MWTRAPGRYDGLSYFVFCCFVALSPGFVVDGWQTSPLLAIWAAGACARWYRGDHQVVTDCFVFGVVNAFLTRAELANFVSWKWNELDVTMATGFWSGLAISIALLAYTQRRHAYRESMIPEPPSDGMTPWTLPYPKPKIFPCVTKHARMFPKRHAFEYSYLQCGFPIIPDGIRADGVVCGGETDAQLGSWWLRIKAGDYLSRENNSAGFYVKLKLFLREQVCCL
jgi:hypothetical protein